MSHTTGAILACATIACSAAAYVYPLWALGSGTFGAILLVGFWTES